MASELSTSILVLLAFVEYLSLIGGLCLVTLAHRVWGQDEDIALLLLGLTFVVIAVCCGVVAVA